METVTSFLKICKQNGEKMAEKLFEQLKKERKKKSALVIDLSLKCTQDEYDILSKKAYDIGLNIEDVLREYVIKESSVFDPIYGEAKAQKKVKKVSVDDSRL